MREYEVDCVVSFGRSDAHESIIHIGNSREKWRLTVRSAIERIEAGGDAFYTLDPDTGAKAYLGIVREAGRPPYLRTQIDGGWTNHLLALGKCDRDCRTF